MVRFTRTRARRHRIRVTYVCTLRTRARLPKPSLGKIDWRAALWHGSGGSTMAGAASGWASARARTPTHLTIRVRIGISVCSLFVRRRGQLSSEGGSRGPVRVRSPPTATASALSGMRPAPLGPGGRETLLCYYCVCRRPQSRRNGGLANSTRRARSVRSADRRKDRVQASAPPRV